MWGGWEIRLLGMGERAGQGGVAGRVGRPWVERFRAGVLFVCVCVCVRGCWWAGWLVDGSVLTLSGCLGGRLGG